MDGSSLRTLDWVGGSDGVVEMVDQTALPAAYDLLRIDNVPDMVAAIQRLSVRGAPAIGVAGAFGVALAVRAHGTAGPAFDRAVAQLRQARPTAVNLARMVDRAAARASEGFDASWPKPSPSVTRNWPPRTPWAASAPTWCSTLWAAPM